MKILSLLIIFPLISFAATSPKCPGEKGYFYTNDKNKRNPRAGGFVSSSANVGDYVFIAPTAAVCGSASVLKFSRVYGNAVVTGEAEVTDKARVYGDARVEGEAVISGDAKVSGNAVVKGDTSVKGTAWIKGHKVLTGGIYVTGRHSSKPSKAFINKKNAEAAAKSRAENAKNRKEMLENAKWGLQSFQRDLKQGWFGEDTRKGFYRSFKFFKSDVKPPCGFYLKMQKEEKTLDSHCRRTKRVRRKVWVPGKSDFENVKDCQTEFSDVGEKYFNLKNLKAKVFKDFAQRRSYLDFNGYYFYIKGGNDRKIKEYITKLKDFAKKYCGHNG